MERAEIINELAEELGNEFRGEISESFDENGDYSYYADSFNFEVDGEEYTGFASYDEAEETAVAKVKEDLENEPSLFNQDWLKSFLYMQDGDIRAWAVDTATSRLDDMSEEEIREYANMDTEYGNLEEKIDELEDKHTDMVMELDVDDENFDELQSDISELEDEIAGYKSELDDIDAEAYDDADRQIQDEVEEALSDDPYDYLVNDLGYTEEGAMSNLQIEVDDASQEAVDMDGWAHFLSTYSGDYNETDNGVVYFRR